jgi:4-hydroxy-tetrahydrodipicolinate reductase
MIKIGVSGAAGKMGKRLINLGLKDKKDIEVVFGLEDKNHPLLEKDFQGVKIVSDPQIIKECDCLIEFSTPEATVEHLFYLAEYKKCAVIGTTGLDSSQLQEIKKASRIIPIVFSPNMSVGVNLLFRLVKEAAKILKEYKIYLEESHHIHKKDAPSGTAKKIAQILNEEGFNIKIEDIKSIREDEIVGDHRVVFESELDRIELFHSAKTRDIFAQGAIKAAKWIVDKEANLYNMEDVLF